MANRWETMETVTNFIFLGSKITVDVDWSHEIKRCLLLGKKVMTNLDSIKKERHYFTNKDPSSQSYGFSSSHVWMWELDLKEIWVQKNWCFWTVVLEKTLESPLDCKEIQPGHPKGYLSWIFIGRTDVEAETPTLWPPDGKNWLIWKDPDAGKDWRWEEKGMIEDEPGHEFGQALGVGDRQGGLACYTPWGHKESDMIEWLNWRKVENSCIITFLSHPLIYKCLTHKSRVVATSYLTKFNTHKIISVISYGSKIPWSKLWQRTRQLTYP